MTFLISWFWNGKGGFNHSLMELLMSFTLSLCLEHSESLIIRKTKTDYLIPSAKDFCYLVSI
jgi:hypothetical protein